MAQWILLNRVSFTDDMGLVVLGPAKIVDDAQYDLSLIRDQGGVLWPASDPQMAKLADDVRKRQQSKGLDDHASTVLTYGLALTKLLALLPTNPSLAQPAWYIDPQNVTLRASDLNDGRTALTPLRTDRERQARLGADGIIANPTNRLDIFFLSNMNASDPFDLSEQVIGLNMVVYIHGTVTPVRTGTFTAVTAIDNTNAGTGGNMLLLTDGAVAWTDKQRVSITSGPRATARAWVKKPLGGGQAACSSMAFPGTGVFDFSLEEVTPQVGDAYQVDGLSSIYMAEQVIRSIGHSTALFTRLMILDAHISQASFTNWLAIHSHEGLSPFILEGCLIDPIIRSPGSSLALFNCYNGGGVLSIYGGVLAITCGVLVTSTGCFIEEGSKLVLDQNVYVTGTSAIKLDGFARLLIGSAGLFDMSDNNTNACILVYMGCTVQIGEQSIAQFTGKALFGNGNAGRIFDVQPLASVTIENTCPVVVKGVGPEFSFDGDMHGWWFDDATSSYGPDGGIETSFANLFSPTPAGFGGDAHHPRKSASVIRTTKHT